MTGYTVVWHDDALQRLTTLWMDSADRGTIAAAADEIDRRLRTAPANCGLLVAPNLREWLVPPLRILYEVSLEDRLVRVVEIDLMV